MEGYGFHRAVTNFVAAEQRSEQVRTEFQEAVAEWADERPGVAIALAALAWMACLAIGWGGVFWLFAIFGFFGVLVIGAGTLWLTLTGPVALVAAANRHRSGDRLSAGAITPLLAATGPVVWVAIVIDYRQGEWARRRSSTAVPSSRLHGPGDTERE